jgi:hypothetical protein
MVAMTTSHKDQKVILRYEKYKLSDNSSPFSTEVKGNMVTKSDKFQALRLLKVTSGRFLNVAIFRYFAALSRRNGPLFSEGIATESARHK